MTYYKYIFAAAISYVFAFIMLIMSFTLENPLYKILTFTHFILAVVVLGLITISIIESNKNAEDSE